CDAIVRSAIADRLGALFVWKAVFACLRGLVTGWLLAAWVCLFRQCETGRFQQEKWIRYSTCCTQDCERGNDHPPEQIESCARVHLPGTRTPTRHDCSLCVLQGD